MLFSVKEGRYRRGKLFTCRERALCRDLAGLTRLYVVAYEFSNGKTSQTVELCECTIQKSDVYFVEMSLIREQRECG